MYSSTFGLLPSEYTWLYIGGIIILLGALICCLWLIVKFSSNKWKNEICLSRIGNVKVSKPIVIITDVILISFLLTGAWDLTIVIMYVLDYGWSVILNTTYIHSLILTSIAFNLYIWIVLFMAVIKLSIAVMLTVWESYYWIGKNNICEVFFKPA